MPKSFKTEMQSARAFGSGDWDKVIEIESEALKDEEHKEFGYTMIAMAYEAKGI